jgi:hypothetical protein
MLNDMGIIKYIGSLIKNDTGNSSKSFTLVLSAIISFISGLVMCSVIAYDGFKDGVIDTNLDNAGIFMLCMGGYMAGGSISKIFGDRARSKVRNWEEDEEDEYMPRKRRKGMYGSSANEETEES